MRNKLSVKQKLTKSLKKLIKISKKVKTLKSLKSKELSNIDHTLVAIKGIIVSYKIGLMIGISKSKELKEFYTEIITLLPPFGTTFESTKLETKETQVIGSNQFKKQLDLILTEIIATINKPKKPLFPIKTKTPIEIEEKEPEKKKNRLGQRARQA